MNFRYELPNDISGWVKYLANSNATVVNSPAGPTLRTARKSANPVLPASKARQTVAKMLVEQFGSIKEVNEELGKIKRGKGEGGKLVEILEKMNALDDRVEVKELFKNLQASLPELEERLEKSSGEWGYEDPIYRFYYLGN